MPGIVEQIVQAHSLAQEGFNLLGGGIGIAEVHLAEVAQVALSKGDDKVNRLGLALHVLQIVCQHFKGIIHIILL